MLALSYCLLALATMFPSIRSTLCADQIQIPDSVCGEPPEEHLLDENGNWKSYEFVMGNCLARRFIRQFGDNETDLDIYSALAKLEKLAEENLSSFDKQLEIAKSDAGALAKINKMRYELKISSAIRQSKRKRSIVNKLLEEARVRVSLADNQINAAMEECLRSSQTRHNGDTAARRRDGRVDDNDDNDVHGNGRQDKCSEKINDTLIEARALRRHLDAQVELQLLACKISQLIR